MTVLYLLDTCVLSELPKPALNQHVRQWIQQHSTECAMSAVSLGEIWYGISRMPTGRRQAQLEVWFDNVRLDFADHIFPADETVFLSYAEILTKLETIGRPQEDFDLLIAATARVHRLTLVTRNTKHFIDTGLPLVNPWEARPSVV
jgi:toxin FitB